MTYVIIGAGPAGVVAAETLAKTDPGAETVLLGGEADPPYSRMAIPYVLTGIIDHGGTHLRKTAGHYETLGITYRQGIAEGIDPKAKKVKLQGGGEQPYDKLLIATGASPIKPPVPGLDLPGVHHCWTLDDCREIEKLADKGAHVVLMGAGFIGCIILEALAERGYGGVLDVVAVDVNQRSGVARRAGIQTAGWGRSGGRREDGRSRWSTPSGGFNLNL